MTPLLRERPGSALPSDARAGTPRVVDRRGALALSMVPGVGPVRWRTLLDEADGDAARALARLPRAIAEGALAEADAATRRAAAAGLALRTPADRTYPAALLDLDDPPPALWLRGDETLAARAPRVAIVGTRAHSPYGARVARALAEGAARAGAVVVSGMARGIDAAAHEGALAVDGATIAVLGTGADVAYPAAHRALHRRIGAQGLVLSERPPGATAGPGAFPRRNRLIAALADVVLVVEAGVRSGALITAAAALELGRPVAAVPGPIDLASTVGSNALLRDGAHVVAAPDDLLELLGLGDLALGAGAAPRPAPSTTTPLLPPGLGDDERAVWDALGDGALDPDSLAARTALPARRCLAALTALEMAGAVAVDAGGSVVRR